MSNTAQQIITFGTQKLLLINGTAHKLDSATANEWATEWFSRNWSSVRVVGNAIHLPSLAIVSKVAADYFANSDYRGKRLAMAAVQDGKITDMIATY